MAFDDYIAPACPSWAPLLGFMGMAAAVVFSSKVLPRVAEVLKRRRPSLLSLC